jgi:hypothetical protein
MSHWLKVLLVAWVAFSPVVGFSIGQFIDWCGNE